MRNIIGVLIIAVCTMSAQELSLGDSSDNVKKSNLSTQALQVHSSKTLDSAIESLKSVPVFHKQHVGIYQSGEYYATRYSNPAYPKIPRWIINDFKKAKFNTQFILVPDPNNKPIGHVRKKESMPATTKSASVNTTKIMQYNTQVSTLDEHSKTRLMMDAQKAYEQRDYTQATIYYEMMVASDIKDKQILLNLCYLYGREGSSTQMEKLVEGKRGVNDYYYAYGIGALESGNRDVYTILAPQLAYDKSGRLAMLCGYFYERENNLARSASFYKIAYTANPNDPYILYAYARSVDMTGDVNNAIYLYTQLSNMNSSEEIKAASRGRISTLRNTQ
jgi:tetratricopeptide (TPR) repeat protein